jgi:hypothetical protein
VWLLESGPFCCPDGDRQAVIDALSHLGVSDITLPVTAETVWRALKTAKAPRYNVFEK